jgi:FkbM family methyltransferase
MKLVNTKYGEMYVIPGDNVISRSLALYGEWAKDELDFLSEFIEPGAHVLDIGAYIGTHSIAFARFTGSQGKVYAFEPRREIFQMLSSNIAVNKCGQVAAFNMGVSDRLGQAILEPLDLDAPDNFGGLELASLATGKPGGYQATINTIDSLRIARADFIKIDVEGMEQSVLDGAMETITTLQPTIFCECNSLEIGAGIFGFANSVGYAVFGFLSDAFSKNNFNGAVANIFGDAKELGMLLVPRHRLGHAKGLLDRYRICPVDGLDAIALLLLHKPQYPSAILSGTAAAGSLGTLYPSPLSRAQNQEIMRLTAQLAARDAEVLRIRSSFSWALTKPLRALQYRFFSRRPVQPQPPAEGEGQ